MSESTQSLRRKIASARELQSVVRTMKALAASSIGQYEKSVHGLADYYRTVELGLGACLRENPPLALSESRQSPETSGSIGVIVFGSDQGLVGEFNEVITDHAISELKRLNPDSGKRKIWVVGERVHSLLEDARLPVVGQFPLPTSVKAIVPLVAQIQIETELDQSRNASARLHIFHNQPQTGGLYRPVSQRLLPLDDSWQKSLAEIPWPTKLPPQVIADTPSTLASLVREYLFISLFRASAESLASENAGRLSAMQRADRNIGELLGQLHADFHHLRQTGIDAELFDVISGFEALVK